MKRNRFFNEMRDPAAAEVTTVSIWWDKPILDQDDQLQLLLRYLHKITFQMF